jgi:hypothetical protein
MSLDFLNLLKETFKDIDGLNRDKIRDLTKEAIRYFAALVEEAEAGSAEEIQKAMQTILEIRGFLEEAARQLPSPESTKLSDEHSAALAEMGKSLIKK